MNLRTCPKCKIEKSVDDFYKIKRNSHGFSSQCKPCHKETCRKWEKSIKGKEWIRAAGKKKYKKIAKTQKRRAHEIVSRAIRTGKLKRENCQICSSSVRVDAHHEAYDRPLNITWLCRPHHIARHKQLDVMI